MAMEAHLVRKASEAPLELDVLGFLIASSWLDTARASVCLHAPKAVLSCTADTHYSLSMGTKEDMARTWVRHTLTYMTWVRHTLTYRQIHDLGKAHTHMQTNNNNNSFYL